MAEGGVLFLDEVDALSHSAQSRLLRFLQERVFKPLGAEHFRRANVRVLAASNQDLTRLVAEGRFRSDLFFRLSVVPLHLMPLRERPGDIRLLATRFLEESNRCAGGPRRRFTEPAFDALCSHAWPGNIRELYNLVQRAVVLVERNEIDAGDLALPVKSATAVRSSSVARSFRESKALAVAEFEREFVQALLRKHDGNISRASREARKDRRALGRLAKKYALVPSKT
jgi:two-component system response regulator GlrR